jgi:hypothetical protein
MKPVIVISVWRRACRHASQEGRINLKQHRSQHSRIPCEPLAHIQNVRIRVQIDVEVHSLFASHDEQGFATLVSEPATGPSHQLPQRCYCCVLNITALTLLRVSNCQNSVRDVVACVAICLAICCNFAERLLLLSLWNRCNRCLASLFCLRQLCK